MIAGVVEYLEILINSFGFLGVLGASFLEELIFFLPSPVVMISSGFFILNGPVSPDFFFVLFIMIAVPYAVGVTLASFIFYGALYFLGEIAVQRWGRWFGVSWNDIEKLKIKMRKNNYEKLTLFSLRVIPIIPSAVLASICGFIKMRVITYTFITLAGVFVRTAIFASLGWFLGEAYRRYAEKIGEIESLIGYIFLFLFISLIIFAYFYTQRRSKDMLQ